MERDKHQGVRAQQLAVGLEQFREKPGKKQEKIREKTEKIKTEQNRLSIPVRCGSCVSCAPGDSGAV